MVKQAISILIQLSGSYQAQYQFDGQLKELIKGEAVAEKTVNKECQLSALFDKVILESKPHLKINIKAICTENKSTVKIDLAPEYIRLSDLKTLSSQIYISEKFNKVQLKVLNLDY